MEHEMIRKSLLALAAIAALGVVVAPSSDALAKGFNGPKGFSNGKGPGPTVHPKGPQNWAQPKGPKKPNGPQNWAGPKKGGNHKHGHSHGNWRYGAAFAGLRIIERMSQDGDCYRVITRSGRIKTVCTY
jgi:hypothetical protein